MADPGFPIGGHGPRRGAWTPRQLCFENFACQNERIWTLGGGGAPGTPPPRSANAMVNREPSANHWTGSEYLPSTTKTNTGQLDVLTHRELEVLIQGLLR